MATVPIPHPQSSLARAGQTETSEVAAPSGQAARPGQGSAVRRNAAVAAMLVGGAASNQAGAAIGATLFASIGPLGVVALRQLVASIVLLPIARPSLRTRSFGQLWPAFALGVCIVVMNSFLYLTIQRLGLGLAVTLEFLGPLAIALIASRKWLDGVCALLAGAGVVLITGAGATTDLLGVLLGLCSAAGWAGYILLNRTIGSRLPGVEGTSLATLTAAVVMVPLAMVFIPLSLFTPQVLIAGFVVGVLASVVPYCVDIWALRRAKAGLFSLMQSIHPLMAVLAGTVILGQLLAPLQLAAVGLITAANLLAISRSGTARVHDAEEFPAP